MTPQQQQEISTSDDDNFVKPLVARKVTPSQLVECGQRLRAGDLVAFPTETVYGLGCHALDPSAVQKVFAAKERPLTDPLIVHVAKTQDAMPLWKQQDDNNNNNDNATKILQVLADSFWPGPLTLVAPAAPHVPPILMANTGFVACRCPSHALAQALIQEAQVPIAAPSANKFGHVSPTRADHVMDDLGHENVWVLEEQQQQQQPACQVGVESTVAKLEIQSTTAETTTTPYYALTVLRQGAIAVQDLQESLTKAGIQNVQVSSLSSRTVEETEATVAPGQTIKHYAPRIPSFLIAPNLLFQKEQDAHAQLQLLAQQSIVLDFGGKLVALEAHAKNYRDLSPSGDSSQAAQCVFEALRWAEQVEPATTRTIVFPQVVSNNNDDDALTLALQDRLTRAASGVVLDSVDAIEKVLKQQQLQ
ncbi:Threonylcarbamoyl-AMP synthase [Seminavis robusta]|uniref:Threonylcarbamoyl-AMP synthase n=1 Tax=Seminavis robusta TaxID=568900 RepID=A0A9N8D7W6_9STRA|nr:Threonylcarbamoyl-AMP synthase [Seminavis robusta]|eukprot:Sro29_g019200.1 Threonylcarbamoyl-AMP synthase (419) ;mRNA; f:99290-100546